MNKNLRNSSGQNEEISTDLLSYWKRQLAGIPFQLRLPTEKGRLLQKSFHTKHVSFAIPKATMDGLNQLSANEDTILFVTLLAVYNTLLYRYTGQKDIVVVYPDVDYSINHKGKLVTNTGNKTALRTDLSGNPDFSELLARQHKTVSEANSHKSLSFDTLTQELSSGKNPGNNGTFEIMFAFQSATETNKPFTRSPVYQQGKTSFELTFFITETKDGLHGTAYFCPDLYSEYAIGKMSMHFQELLNDVIKNPQKKIDDLTMLTPREKNQLLVEFNNTDVEYPRDKSIVDLFEEQVAKTPHGLAAVFENEKLTYKELNEQSNKLAHFLQGKGVKSETLVPLCVERSMEMIIGVLGILKSGGAYVPIDPDYPVERIRYIVEDTEASIVIGNKATRAKLKGVANTIIELSEQDEEICAQSVENLELHSSPHNLAYVIYTSGSTGKPKGVMIEHKALADHCFGLIKSAGLETCRSFALFSPLVFDAGHAMIFTSFLLGASLHIMSRQAIMESEKLKLYLRKNEVDCIKIVPSLWLTYAGEKNLVLAKKAMIFGGESFPKTLLDYFKKINYHGNIFNHYGPTEATIGKCIHKINLKKNYHIVPIGKPFSNTQLYVVDEYLQLVPIGISGELLIAGEGLAREYLHQPALTKEKFIPSRFKNDPGAKMYKTGDKVRWLPDGNIEYLGRIDQQVKIHGHRIELGEIESALAELTALSQVVVLAREDDGPDYKKLVAYFVLKPGATVNSNELRLFLGNKLPEYMVPAIFVELKSMPLTTNSKIDRKALPVPGKQQLSLSAKATAPRNVFESKLIRIFKRCLKIEDLGVKDNLFEIGGTSMQAYQIFAHIKRVFGHQLPLSILFEAPTIEQLAVILQREKAKKPLSCLVPIQPNGSKTPLFFIHAGAGTVLFYKEIVSHLNPDQPVYGLQAQGIDGKQPYHKTIEEMAAHYINEIRTVQPEGPYLLGGYCFGGAVAFEIARRLTEQGKKVNMLALFNSRSPLYKDPRPSATSKRKESAQVAPPNVIAAFKLKIEAIPLGVISTPMYFARKIKNRLWNRKIKAKLKRIGYFTMVKIRMFIHKTLMRVGLPCPEAIKKPYFNDTNSDMVRAYRPNAYTGKMIIFRSPRLFPDPNIGWKTLVEGEIETIDIPGRHTDRRDIMNGPFTVITGRELNFRLDLLTGLIE